MSKLYVVGDRELGVLFIKSDPLKVTHLSKSTIQNYASSKGITYDAAFAAVATGAKAIINKTQVQPDTDDLETSYEAIGNLIGRGTVLSDVDFCFAANIDDSDWSAKRGAVPPLSSVLSDLNPSLPPDAQLKEGRLV